MMQQREHQRPGSLIQIPDAIRKRLEVPPPRVADHLGSVPGIGLDGSQRVIDGILKSRRDVVAFGGVPNRRRGDVRFCERREADQSG